jgi:glycosyltransferase involved in cell wall biosynthesis
MVTADRPQLCRRAVQCYLDQTYPHKELVVVDDGVTDLASVLAEVPSNELRYIKLERKPSNVLGTLRNVSLGAASGEFVAQWDDDDWYHPDRLTRQIAALADGHDACCLTATLMHVNSGKYFLHPYAGYLRGGVPGTIVHRNTGGVSYPEVRRAEDDVYLNYWRNQRYVELPASDMHLFIRCFHGGNTWELEHFQRRIRNSVSRWILWAWYAHVRRDLFAHPGFRLDEASRQAFERFLADSRRAGLFPAGS